MMTRFVKRRRPEGYSQRDGAAIDEESLSQTLPESSSRASQSEPQIPTILEPHRVVTASQSLTPRAKFAINWTELYFQHKRLRNPRLRMVTKQSLSKLNSYIWQYGQELTADGLSRLWVCRFCHLKRDFHHGVFKAESTNGISNHLLKQHSIKAPKDDLPPPPFLPPSLPSVQEEDTETHCGSCGHRKGVSEEFDGKQYKQQYIDWVIRHNLPFYMATHPDTLALLRSGAQDILAEILPKAESSLSIWVMDSYLDRLPTMVTAIKSAKSLINISCDAWKGDNKKNYLAVCSHFINKDYKQTRMLLGFPRVLGSKTGENEAEIIAKVLTTFDIDATRLGAFTADNASDNDTCCDRLEILLGMDNGWSIHSRIRCIGHIINLIVEDLLYGDHEQSKHTKRLASVGDEEAYDIWIQLGLIGRVHNLCIYINRSPERREAFSNLQKEMSLLKLLVLLVDGGIRWHSTYQMINRIIALRDIILKWQRQFVYDKKGVDIRPSFLSMEDFEMLEIWAAILKDFKQLCLEEEVNADMTSQGTVAGVLKGLTFIYDRIDTIERDIKALKLAPHLAKPFEVGLREARIKTMKYLQLLEATNLYYAAVFLDPNWRLAYFEDKWAQYDHKSWYKKAEAGIKEIYSEYCDKYAPSPSLSPSPSPTPSESIENLIIESRLTAYSQFNRLSAKYMSKKRKASAVEDEYTRYTKYWDPAEWQFIEDIIEWWRDHVTEFPILSRMAFDILSIPGMSAEVERIFSAAGRLITDARSCLKDDTIEASEVQHHGLRKNGLFSVSSDI